LLARGLSVFSHGYDSEIEVVYPETQVGGKWFCVVVKYEEADAFVVTAYLTNRPKAGEDLWPTR